MTATLKQTLAAMPARQLNLLAAGAVLIASALAWTVAVRAPLAALRVQQARLAALAAAGNLNPNAAQPPRSSAPPSAPPPAPTPLALIAAVSADAQASGVAVASAVPGPERVVAGLRQQTLTIDASGSYQAILDWIAAIEAHQPAAGILRLELRALPDGTARQVRLQLGVYAAETPA